MSQTGDVWGDTGGGGSIWLTAKVVYGRVTLSGVDTASRPPKITVTVTNAARITATTTLDRSGNFCFRDIDGSGATIVVEVEGREVGREVLETGSPTMPKQFRRDFEIVLASNPAAPKPAVVSAKYPYQRSDRNSKLFAMAETAISAKDDKGAEKRLRELLISDPEDFIAWAKLGSVYYERNEMPDAEKAFQKSLAANATFAPAMMNLGRVFLVQKQIDPAIGMFFESDKN